MPAIATGGAPKGPRCPHCQNRGAFQSGRNDSGQQVHRCLACGRFFQQAITSRAEGVPQFRNRAFNGPFEER